MTPQRELWSGGWWRFSEYEIWEEAIQPTEDASLEGTTHGTSTVSVRRTTERRLLINRCLHSSNRWGSPSMRELRDGVAAGVSKLF